MSKFTQGEIASDGILVCFSYEHLPEHLQARSKPFAELARHIIDNTPRNPERTTALRKLREAKDCAITAHILDAEWSKPAPAT